MTEDSLPSRSQDLDPLDLRVRVLDSVTAEIAVLDVYGEIVYVNDAWRDFADSNGGTPQATGVGANYLDVCRRSAGEDSPGAEEAYRGIQDVLLGAKDYFVLEYPCHSSTSKRWFLLYVSRLKGTQDFAVASHVSITERKMMEERLVMSERLAAIGQAMEGLSHEGRKSLQRSQASLDLLRQHLADDQDALKLLERVGQAQDRLLGVYEDVRNYAAPISIRYEACRLDEVVTAVMSEMALQRPPVRLSHTPLAGTREVEVDVLAIRQVLRLVLDNAVEASDPNSEVNVSYLASDLDGSPAVTIIVSDEGPGVPENRRDEVFEPFCTTKPNGTGLGLAICRRIVAAHGGMIRFGDPLLGGASIYITLPVRQVRSEFA